MKKKTKLLTLVSLPLLSFPVVLSVSCSNAATGNGMGGNDGWMPNIEDNKSLINYNYSDIFKNSRTGWNANNNTATIDLAALIKLSPSFPFENTAFDTSTLDPFFKNYISNYSTSEFAGRSNIYNFLAKNNYFPSSMVTSTFSYSWMDKYYDGTTEGPLDNPGFYHVRPTSADGHIGSLAAPAWNKIDLSGVTPEVDEGFDPDDASDDTPLVAFTQVKGLIDNPSSKVSGKNVGMQDGDFIVLNSHLDSTEQFKLTYCETYLAADGTTQPLDPGKNGLYFNLPTSSDGSTNDVDATHNKVTTENGAWFAGWDQDFDGNDVFDATTNFYYQNNTNAIEKTLYMTDNVIQENGNTYTLASPITIVKKKPTVFTYDSATNKFVDGSGVAHDIFSPEALEFIEPAKVSNNLSSAVPGLVPTTFGTENASFVMKDYVRHTKQSNAKYANLDGDFVGASESTYAGVSPSIVSPLPSNKLSLVQENNTRSVMDPGTSVENMMLQAWNETDESKANVWKQLNSQLSMTIEGETDTYHFYSTFTENGEEKLLRRFSGFYKEQPTSIEDAKTKAISEVNSSWSWSELNSEQTGQDGFIAQPFNWGKNVEAGVMSTPPSNRRKKFVYNKPAVSSDVTISVDFKPGQKVNLGGGLEITPLPQKPNADSTVQSFMANGFTVSPEQNIVANVAPVNESTARYGEYVLDNNGTANDITDDRVYKYKYYFDVDGATDVVPGAPGSTKYLLPQSMIGYYNVENKLNYEDYANAVILNNRIDDAKLTEFVIDNGNYHNRLVLPNEDGSTKAVNGIKISPSILSQNMMLHNEFTISDEMGTQAGIFNTDLVPKISGTVDVSGKQFNLQHEYSPESQTVWTTDGTATNGIMSSSGSVGYLGGRNLNVANEVINIKLVWSEHDIATITGFNVSNIQSFIESLRDLYTVYFAKNIESVYGRISSEMLKDVHETFKSKIVEEIFMNGSSTEMLIGSVRIQTAKDEPALITIANIIKDDYLYDYMEFIDVN